MLNCPNCSTQLPDDAKFCTNCGEATTTSCPECGTDVRADANFCPGCSADLSAGERGMDRSGTGPSSGNWRLAADEFAKRLGADAATTGSSLIDRLKRTEKVVVEEGNAALLLEDGRLVETLGPGKHELDSLVATIKRLGSSRDYTVVVVDETSVTIPLTVTDLRTADEGLVDVSLELSVAIADRERFFRSTMQNREVVTTTSFARDIGGALRDELQATIQSHERDDLYGNPELTDTIEGTIESECRELLERKGLELVSLVSFEYDDDRDEVRQERHEVDVESDEVDVERRREEVERERQDVEHSARERETDDEIHEKRESERERVGKRTAEQSADHEIEIQSKEHEHERIEKEQEIDDTERRHEHKAERETVEHEEELKTTRTESEVERRDAEHEQDVKEMEDLIDVKKKKDERKLDRKERETEIEMREEEHDVEMERERLAARDDVDAETLASLDDTDEEMADLAKMDKAENLSAEQLDALEGHEQARVEAEKADHVRERLEDQKEFREEVKEMAEDSMDRMQETTDRAMDSMGGTAEAAAEDTSDNVIVSGSGDGGSSGDTTIVQGGSGGGDDSGGESGSGGEKVVVCPDCGNEQPHGHDFCMECGADVTPTG